MVMTLLLADYRIRVSLPDSPGILAQCAEYRRPDDVSPDFTVDVTEADVDNERRIFLRRNPHAAEESPARRTDLLSLALYRRICTLLALHRVLLIHGSSPMVDGRAYLYCAPSGTGKSTHTRLLRGLLRDRVTMVNDDKPLVRFFEDGQIRIYGTPWNGKHRLGAPVSAPLEAVCFLHRAAENTIVPLPAEERLPKLLESVFRPEGTAELLAVLDLTDCLMASVRFWSLGCNMDPSAAALSYGTMSGETAS